MIQNIVDNVTDVISFFSNLFENFWSFFGDIRLMDVFDWLPNDIATTIQVVITLAVISFILTWLRHVLLRG